MREHWNRSLFENRSMKGEWKNNRLGEFGIIHLDWLVLLQKALNTFVKNWGFLQGIYRKNYLLSVELFTTVSFEKLGLSLIGYQKQYPRRFSWTPDQAFKSEIIVHWSYIRKAVKIALCWKRLGRQLWELKIAGLVWVGFWVVFGRKEKDNPFYMEWEKETSLDRKAFSTKLNYKAFLGKKMLAVSGECGSPAGQ